MSWKRLMVCDASGFDFCHGWGEGGGKKGSRKKRGDCMKTSPVPITLLHCDSSQASQLSRRIQPRSQQPPQKLLTFIGLPGKWDSLLIEMLDIVLRKLSFIKFIPAYENGQTAHDSPLCNPVYYIFIFTCFILRIGIWLHKYSYTFLMLRCERIIIPFLRDHVKFKWAFPSEFKLRDFTLLFSWIYRKLFSVLFHNTSKETLYDLCYFLLYTLFDFWGLESICNGTR